MVFRFAVLFLACLLAIGCKKVEHNDATQAVDTAATAPIKIPDVAEVPEENAPSPRKRTPIPDDHIKLPKGHSSTGWQKEKYVELLCDPKAHRLSINASPPEFRAESGFPKRTMLKISEFTYYQNYGGAGFAGPLIKYLQCGALTVAIFGDSHNYNGNGREGAHDPFLSVKIHAFHDFRYPRHSFGRGTRLGGLALSYGWTYTSTTSFDISRCPNGFAARVDAWPDKKKKMFRFDKFVQPPARALAQFEFTVPTLT